MQTSEPAAPVDRPPPVKANRFPLVGKRNSRIVLLLTAGVILLLSAVAAYYVFFPGPERAFKQFVNRKTKLIQNRLNQLNSNTQNYELHNLAYEVRKTDSLTSPYVAYISFDLAVMDGRRDNPLSHATYSHSLYYAYQDGKWVYKDMDKSKQKSGPRDTGGQDLEEDRQYFQLADVDFKALKTLMPILRKTDD